MRKFYTYKRVFLLFITMCASGLLFAQEDQAVINNSKSAIKLGNAHELVKYFNEMVELDILGANSNYSKTQAEFVLKDFFKKNPPSDFQFIHRGSSNQGVIYSIGTYTSGNESFKIYVLVKQFNGNYLIDTFNISKI